MTTTDPQIRKDGGAWEKNDCYDALGRCRRCAHRKSDHTVGPLGFCVIDGCGCVSGESVRQEAERLITTDRNDAYGPAAIDYGRTVTMFNTWRNPRHGPLSSSDALMFMVFVKLSRESHKQSRENIVDAHGYLALYAQVVGHD